MFHSIFTRFTGHKNTIHVIYCPNHHFIKVNIIRTQRLTLLIPWAVDTSISSVKYDHKNNTTKNWQQCPNLLLLMQLMWWLISKVCIQFLLRKVFYLCVLIRFYFITIYMWYYSAVNTWKNTIHLYPSSLQTILKHEGMGNFFIGRKELRCCLFSSLWRL